VIPTPIPPTADNPLQKLLDAFGVMPEAMASRLGLTGDEFDRIMHRSDDVTTFIRACRMMGIKFRAERGEPFRIVIPTNNIDSLVFDPDFRAKAGFGYCPRTRRELRDHVRALAEETDEAGEPVGPAAVCRRLERDMIPTTTGLRTWRRGTVVQHLSREGIDLDDLLEPDAEFLRQWRVETVNRFLMACFAFAPAAVLDYSIYPHFEFERVVIENARMMPDGIKTWAYERAAAMDWFSPRPEAVKGTVYIPTE
jgi:hypothetical protein